MDAIAHCIETYLSPRDNPVAEAIALDGLKRASRNIRRAVADGTGSPGAARNALAAVMGGLTFQKGLGAVHAMSHPLGGMGRNPVSTMDAERRDPARGPALNATTSVTSTIDLQRRWTGAGRQPSRSHSERLNADLGLPANLKEMGLPREALPTMVEGALADHSNATNPRPVNREDYKPFEEV